MMKAFLKICIPLWKLLFWMKSNKHLQDMSYIPPPLFGLGVELDNLFASKWLINELSHLGFSISYEEITHYKHSVIASEVDGKIYF